MNISWYTFSLNIIPFEIHLFHRWGDVQNYRENNFVLFISVVSFISLVVIDPSLFSFFFLSLDFE